MISDDKLISFPIFYPYAHLRYQLPNPRQRYLSGSSQRSVHLQNEYLCLNPIDQSDICVAILLKQSMWFVSYLRV